LDLKNACIQLLHDLWVRCSDVVVLGRVIKNVEQASAFALGRIRGYTTVIRCFLPARSRIGIQGPRPDVLIELANDELVPVCTNESLKAREEGGVRSLSIEASSPSCPQGASRLENISCNCADQVAYLYLSSVSKIGFRTVSTGSHFSARACKVRTGDERPLQYV
jgi:hypothetical protein